MPQGIVEATICRECFARHHLSLDLRIFELVPGEHTAFLLVAILEKFAESFRRAAFNLCKGHLCYSV
jgi:hypothetical protein